MSDYRITITRADGHHVSLVPGSQGERDLVDAILAKMPCVQPDRVAAAVAAYGVGIFRSEARVLAALRAVLGNTQAEARYAIESVLADLKREVR